MIAYWSTPKPRSRDKRGLDHTRTLVGGGLQGRSRGGISARQNSGGGE